MVAQEGQSAGGFKDGGAMSQGLLVASSRRKSSGSGFSSVSSTGCTTSPHLEPRETLLKLSPTELQGGKLALFQLTRFVVVCYNGQKKINTIKKNRS